LDKSAEAIALKEVERERLFYNEMIARYNPHPRQRPLTVVARHKLAESGLYTGSYMSAVAAFQQAVSVKRAHKWPGDPYSFRHDHDLRGAKIGVVWSKSQAPTWDKLLAGFSSLATCELGAKRRRNYSAWKLKVSRDDAPIVFTANMRREIPPDALITAIYLVPDGERGESRWWDLQITWHEQTVVVVEPPKERVGVSTGWSILDDGSMLVAITSEARCLRIPPYAIRKAKDVESIQGQRDTWANIMLGELKRKGVSCKYGDDVGYEGAETGLVCWAKSADAVIDWVERNGIHGMRPFVDKAIELRRRQQHNRRRFLDIRDELYRDFAAANRCAYISKQKLRETAEKELKGQEPNHERTWASIHMLEQCLIERGAVEIECESLGDSIAPTLANAQKIWDSGESGNIKIRASRKSVRKYRKRLPDSAAAQDAITTA
jgi:hypothetical protein